MATQVGSLYTSLTLENSSFLSNMKRSATAAEQGAAQIDRAFATVKTAAVGFVAALSVDAIGGLVTRGLDYASSLGEVSQQLGVTAKDLQVYRYAASQAGIGQDEIDKGLQRLTRTIGTGSKAFAELGVNTRDATGATRSTGDVFRDVAEAIAKIPDPARRAALEVELFGKAGQNLDTLLSEGAKGIDGYAKAAADLGIVLDDVAIKKADDAADKMASLNQVLSANIAGVVADNAGSILELANAITSATSAALRGVNAVGDYFRGLKKLKDDAGGGVTGFVKRAGALLMDDADVRAIGARERELRDRRDFTFNIGKTGPAGAPGTLGNPAQAPRAIGSRAAKVPQDIYNGLSASDVRLGGLEKLSDVLSQDGGVSQGLKDILADTSALDNQLKDIGVTAQSIGPIDVITPSVLEAADKFSDNLSRGLGQAIIYGQSLGDALSNSIKAAAAELVTSGLLDLLKGGKSGGLFGSIASGIGAIFGGGMASGGRVKGGMMYDVGELGRERFVAPADGQIIPASMLGGASDNRRQAVAVTVDVQPSPLFVTTVATVSQQAGQRAAAEQSRVANRPRLAGGRG